MYIEECIANARTKVKAAPIIDSFYNPSAEKGKRLDFDNITKAFQEETNYSFLSSSRTNSTKPRVVSSSGALASKINIMETVSPKDYLTLLQNGTMPASPDLKIINILSAKFKLTNPVINVVIDYVLATNNNVLSKAYCEKIAGSLAREEISAAFDAMNYLKKISSGGKEVTYDTGEISKKKTRKEEQDEEKLEWNQLVDDIDIDGGDNDGKA